jgi:hypothetical protein
LAAGCRPDWHAGKRAATSRGGSHPGCQLMRLPAACSQGDTMSNCTRVPDTGDKTITRFILHFASFAAQPDLFLNL